jgi:hypothetical protein
MGDFVETGNNKTSVRALAAPIADVAAFAAIVESVLTTNPFGCIDYLDGGVTMNGVQRGRETYTVRVDYANGEGRTIGAISARAPTVAGFTANATEIMGNAPLATAMGGTAVRDSERETYSCQIRCHDPNGEDYVVTLTRRAVRLSSYADDAIRTKVETWADTVPALA